MIPTWLWGVVIDCVALTYAWLLAHRRRVGWLVMAFNMAVLWTAFTIRFHQWGFIPGIIVHTGVAIHGWIQWGKHG